MPVTLFVSGGVYPGSVSTNGALRVCGELVFVRGLNMDVCLVIGRIVLVFRGSLEETTLRESKGVEYHSATPVSLVYTTSPGSPAFESTSHPTAAHNTKNSLVKSLKIQSIKIMFYRLYTFSTPDPLSSHVLTNFTLLLNATFPEGD